MSSGKVWKDTSGECTDNVFNVTSGKVYRSILSHIANAETGRLDGCMLLYRGSKSNKSAYYHTEVNWDVFSDLCKTKVFPAISSRQRQAMVVLDRATYHSVLDDDNRWPVKSWKKN